MKFMNVEKNLTPENIQEVLELKQSLILPISQIKDIEYVPPTFLVDQLIVEDTVGFISASPGSTKTWFVWEIALSVATGSKCMEVFDTKKASVLAFNAEDSPGAVTKPRLSALASKKGVRIDDVNELALINTPSLMVDDEKTQSMIRATVEYYKPKLLILDPFRQVHRQNEDKASDMAPILGFLREIQRSYGVTVLLVCHERKGGGYEGERRADRTRGSNVLEGWRDTAVYMDRPDRERKTYVQIYHRGYLHPEPFYFELQVSNEEIGGQKIMTEAQLKYVSGQEIENNKLLETIRLAFDFIKINGPCSANSVVRGIERKKIEVLSCINMMLEREIIVRESKELAVPFKYRSNFVPSFVNKNLGIVPF